MQQMLCKTDSCRSGSTLQQASATSWKVAFLVVSLVSGPLLRPCLLHCSPLLAPTQGAKHVAKHVANLNGGKYTVRNMINKLAEKLAGRIRPFGGICGSPFWPSFSGHLFVSNFCVSEKLDTVSALFESRCPNPRCHLSHVVVEDRVIFVEGRFSYIPAHAHVGHSLTFP